MNKKTPAKVSEEELDLTNYSLITRHLIMPNELNPNHSIFGGQLIAWLDTALYVYLTGVVKYKLMVTVGMNNVHFKKPAYLGEIIEIYGSVKQVRKSSVTAYGKAIAVDASTGISRLIIQCEITYVAINDKGKPVAAFANFKI
ncbi:MAG: acyl-CoA thioesterase [Spirochaetia bacterium]|nr:acyl-CoA thioesterase [Spirochaetia bacterium]